MRKIPVYVDTSVFGGFFDEEFAEPSQRFFERVKTGDFLLLISQNVIDELAGAPHKVQNLFKQLPEEILKFVPTRDEALSLAQAYIEAKILGEASRQDARHVAIATVEGAELILSWNFKHIVNYQKIRLFNSINLREGYRSIDIRSPLEVMNDEEEI